jgi:ABC-type methionine transport system ATPase subunit
VSALLTLERVSMQYAERGQAPGERVALRDVSLEIESGEFVAVWGQRHSGRTTLLRIAAGVTAPTTGSARFDGVSLTRRSMLGMPHGIAYATTHFEPMIGKSVLEHVAAPLLGRGYSIPGAQARAYSALRRAGVATCATLSAAELDGAEIVRVAVARALITRPSLLLVDQPTDEVPPLGTRDELLELLRSIAHRDAVAVVMTTEEGAGVVGADRALTLDRGTLRGLRPLARVIPLRRPSWPRPPGPDSPGA